MSTPTFAEDKTSQHKTMGESNRLPSNSATPEDVCEMDYLHADMDDIIFRNRNKEYGAYFLRKHYSAYMTRSNIIAIIVFLLAINIPNFSRLIKENMPQDQMTLATEVTLTEPPPLDKAAPPPPPPPVVEPPPLRKATIAFVAPRVKKDEEVMEEVAPPDVEELKNVEISTVTREGVENGLPEGLEDEGPVGEAPPPKAIEEETPEKETPPFKVVEQMPSYPDGEAGMLKFIYSHIQYPPVARDNGVEGTVYVTFVVEKDGSITNAKVARDIGGGCGEEAVRVIKQMPNWIPGKQRGRLVRVQFALPVKFDLK